MNVSSLFRFLSFFVLVNFLVKLAPAAERPVVLYDFREQKGDVVRDRSGVGKALDLKIEKTSATEWRDGALEVKGDTIISSSQPATKITEAVKKSGEISIAVWLRPKNHQQEGPARIVTVSRNTSERNFTLGQEKDRYDVRLRASSTSNNGTPSITCPSNSVSLGLTHLVYTRDKSGNAKVYIDGKPRGSRSIKGDLKKLADDYKLALANEIGGGRPWLGELHRVAIYADALTSKEVSDEFRATKPRVAQQDSKPAEEKKEEVVAKQEPSKKDAEEVKEPAKPSEPVVNLPPVKLPGGRTLEHVDFERHVMGILGRQGCNTGACHGALQGESDLQLSLFSYDAKMDYESLTLEDYGPFVDLENPDFSPLLRKPTLQSKHEGGERFAKGGWQYEVLRNWILAGARREEGYGKVEQLIVTPDSATFGGLTRTQDLHVEAVFADGSREDVTAFATFETRDEFVAEVTEEGKVRAVNPGDTSVVVAYRDRVTSFRAMVSESEGVLATIVNFFQNPVSGGPTPANYIDKAVFAKLDALSIEPSEVAADGEFLRRLYIDTIGRVPTLEEAEAFLADKDKNKREKKIDELLTHPLHAALWATKFSDITGNDTRSLDTPGEKRSRMWHDWLRVRFERNAPYNEIVRGILLATSRDGDSIDKWIEASRSWDEDTIDSFESDYAERDTLDLFWARKGLDIEQMAEQTASAFLGVQLQCAQCHKHPYDQWSQSDYRAYANAFAQVESGKSQDARKAIDEENNRRKKIKDKKKRLPSIKEVYLDEKPNFLKDPVTNKTLPPMALGGVELKQEGDYREALYQWMVDKENPYFARAFVNRVWAHYMGVGIVEPVDSFAAGNPPSNEPLLAALAESFLKSGFNIRELEKEILRSKVYQLSSIPNESNSGDTRNYARKYARRMMAENVVDVVNTALGMRDEFERDAPKGSMAIEVAASSVKDGDLSYVFRLFGRPERTTVCDCERSSDPTLPQSLYLMTDGDLQNKIKNGRLKTLLNEDKRLDRLRKGELGDSEKQEILDKLFLATLTRLPNDGERAAAMETVNTHENGEQAYQDILWALINTREFVLNH